MADFFVMPRLLACGLLSLALLTLLFNSSARADWRDTRWQMSLDEVRGLYPDGQLIKSRKPEVAKVEAYWVASYEENGERYSVLFEFHRDRLTEIWVNGKSEKACTLVIDQVENKLGKPFLDEQYGQTSEKRWKSSTELIVARKAKVADGYSGNLCGVQYKPFGVVG